MLPPKASNHRLSSFLVFSMSISRASRHSSEEPFCIMARGEEKEVRQKTSICGKLALCKALYLVLSQGALLRILTP